MHLSGLNTVILGKSSVFRARVNLCYWAFGAQNKRAGGIFNGQAEFSLGQFSVSNDDIRMLFA